MTFEDTEKRIEDMFKIVAEHQEFLEPDDALTAMINSTTEKYQVYELNEEELAMAAGGVKIPDPTDKQLIDS